jgi:hypothetical protein
VTGGTVSRMRLVTAGTTVDVRASTARQAGRLAAAAGLDLRDGGGPAAVPGPTRPEVEVVVEHGRRRFDTSGMSPVTRGVWSSKGTVVIDDVGGSGFSQCWRPAEDHVEVRTRWAPGVLAQGATGLRTRFDALRAQVLLHYPALWWAGTRGLAPLHVSVLDVGGVVVALAGPGGVGKSTLVARALSRGARATCDNVAVCDGETAHGLREPLRIAEADGGPATGARTTHGRREMSWTGQVPSMRPDVVVVVRRGVGPRVRDVDPSTARRALVAGTYAAGELRRFWALTAVLGLATGRGPVQPEVDAVAQRLTERVPCLELELGTTPGAGLHSLLGPFLDSARRQGAHGQGVAR